MPQVDLETLVCGGGCAGDGKVSCETLIGGEGMPKTAAVEDPDLPAESFLVRIGDEIGLVDINVVYDRDDSTKGNTNPKSQQQQNSQSHQKARSNSQRFSGSLKSKAPIIGLPNKIQHPGYLSHSVRHPTQGRIFPKGGGGGGRKPAVPTAEPGSPKVSCFGKVLSGREQDRCRTHRRSLPEEERQAGCWESLSQFFQCGGGVSPVEYESSAASGSIPAAAKKLPPSATAEPPMAAPGLGGMKRFASARRAASWGGDVDVDVGDADGHVAWSEPLDREVMRGRRSVGSLEDASHDRDW